MLDQQNVFNMWHFKMPAEISDGNPD